MKLPKVLTTSVVRGATQGQSHGGVFLVDLETESSELMFDWDSGDIDFTGRGADRGLRGIAFEGNEIYIAASDEIFVFDRSFKILRSYRNRYLKHCHEIARYGDQLFVTSTGFDSILVLNIRTEKFVWGMHLGTSESQLRARIFDPLSNDGPLLRVELHLNSVFCTPRAVITSGMRHNRLMRFCETGLDALATLPLGTHNVQLHRKGLLFNDTEHDCVRYVSAEDSRSIPVPRYRPTQIVNALNVSDRVARPHFARGLCPLGDRWVVAGSSPSTIAIHDLDSGETLKSINLSMDVRNAIHGLELWPYVD